MTASAPIAARYEGEGVFAALPRQRAACDKEYVVGQIYAIEMHEDRSGASHRHYFSAIRETWLNLRDDQADRFRSPEALRKYALIRSGFADSTSIVASSKAEAQRIAAFIRPTDEFAVVTVEGATVTRWTAQSQSTRAMGKERFQASKQAVLDVLADLLGTARAEIEDHARAA